MSPPPGTDSAKGRSLLARATVTDLVGRGEVQEPRSTLDRVMGAGVRGVLTSWVRIGVLVSRLRGRDDRLEDDAGRTFALLAGLLELALEGRPLPVSASPHARRTTHIRLLTTPLPSGEAMRAAEQTLAPYTTTSSTTTAPPIAIGYFAVRELLAQRAQNFSVQVVHLTPSSTPAEGPKQVSIQLPRDVPLSEDARGTPAGAAALSGRPVTLDVWLADLAYTAGMRAVAVPSQEDLLGSFGWDSQAPGAEPGAGAGDSSGSARRAGAPAGAPGPSDDDRQVEISLTATVPATVTAAVALRLVEIALRRLLGPDLPPQRLALDADQPGILIRHWQAQVDGHPVALTAAARTGTRRRPTHVVLSGRAPAALAPAEALAARASAPDNAATVETFPAGADAGEGVTRRATEAGDLDDLAMARDLLLRPVWWRSTSGRVDGDDVILYEAVVGSHRLRVRANDYPHEPMYTLLVGPSGAVTAALDLERWPPDWSRPVLE